MENEKKSRMNKGFEDGKIETRIKKRKQRMVKKRIMRLLQPDRSPQILTRKNNRIGTENNINSTVLF